MFDPSSGPPERGFATKSAAYERSPDADFFDFALFAATIVFLVVAGVTIYIVEGRLGGLKSDDLETIVPAYFGPAAVAAAAVHALIRWLPHIWKSTNTRK